jgi:hypothetical protein
VVGGAAVAGPGPGVTGIGVLGIAEAGAAGVLAVIAAANAASCVPNDWDKAFNAAPSSFGAAEIAASRAVFSPPSNAIAELVTDVFAATWEVNASS